METKCVNNWIFTFFFKDYSLDRFPLELSEQLVISPLQNLIENLNFQSVLRFGFRIMTKSKIQILFPQDFNAFLTFLENSGLDDY